MVIILIRARLPQRMRKDKIENLFKFQPQFLFQICQEEMKASTKCVLAFTFSCHLLAPADPTKQAPIYMSHAPTTKGKGKVNRCQFQAILGKQNERNLFLAEFVLHFIMRFPLRAATRIWRRIPTVED